ncbi:GerMN domain-containing protein [Desulfobacterales bacterium HSG16]|nr:GerMN domain-containing protein [Desulfobacterales bacterium HSG16]
MLIFMKKFFGVAAGLVISAICIAGFFFYFKSEKPGSEKFGSEKSGRVKSHLQVSALRPDTAAVKKRKVQLYFADNTCSFLRSEERIIAVDDYIEMSGIQIVNALIKGPFSKKLFPTIPEGVFLRALYIDGKNTAFVDLSRSFRDNHPQGVAAERLTIYSIVNSLILNLADINAVKILIAGKESMTLAGHIDLRPAFTSNIVMIR